jgi:tRNA-2-methylthio-N6-dimethylallyladenosine synthase
MAENINIISEEEMKIQKDIIKKIRIENEKNYRLTGDYKKALIITLGCQQNENDSEKIRGMLSEMGYQFTDDKKEADIVLYNTCCVRENAELKVFGNIGIFKKIKENKPDLIVGICGCMMQQEHIVEKIKSKYKHVDIVFGTHTLYKFPENLYKVLLERQRVIDIEDIDGYIIEGFPHEREDKVKALVSIMSGCNNFCSYCIVPYVRGRERSRNPEDILKEVRVLAEKGYKEITLLGQNVNSYGGNLNEKIDFADLLRMVNDIDGIERIRFMTSHPKDISDKLIKTMGECKKVCEHLHLPIQAGSNNVLEKMNRKYTKEKYLDIIKKVKKEIPGISLSSDIIVGFPGETNEDFKETLDVVKKVGYDSLYTFIYSKRIGTPAVEYEDVISDEEKHKNFDVLVKTHMKIAYNKNLEYIGKDVEVLVEGFSKTNIKTLTGRTRTNKIVNFKGDKNLIGKLINVNIYDVKSFYLSGKITK